jgi:hypothetical protein
MPGLTLLADLPVPTRTWTNGHHMDRAWRSVTNISFPRNNGSLIELFLFANVPYVSPCPPRCLNILYLRHVETGRSRSLSRAHAHDLMGVSTHLESASFFAEPRGRNPYVLRNFWGDGEFRHGSEIRGIREKIAKEVGKTATAGEFSPLAG